MRDVFSLLYSKELNTTFPFEGNCEFKTQLLIHS